jgi:predicted transcriptional regulator
MISSNAASGIIAAERPPSSRTASASPARGQPGDQVAEPLGAADPGRRHERGQPEPPGGLGQPGRPQSAGIQPGRPATAVQREKPGDLRRAAGRLGPLPRQYDTCMKRITVSLPEELVEKIKRAAGGKRQVSSYVATALEDYQERESLDDVLAAWREETSVPEEVRRQVEAELDDVGLTGLPGGGDRLAG